MKLSQTINSYLTNKCTLWNVVETISTLDIYKNINVSRSLKYVENDESDKSLIATVLLWCLKDSPIKDLSNTNNSFIKFLHTIRSSESDFYNQDIKWIFNDDHSCTFKKDNLLFVINDDDSTKRMQLPDEFCDKTILCLNCNEELHTSYFIDVPSNTFYIIEVIK